jgi:hypothetical protein
VGYGTNESFAGPEGLPKFEQQLKKLLDDLSPTKARFVLLSPMSTDVIALPPSVDRDKVNKNLIDYGLAIGAEAHRRKFDFVNLWLSPPNGLTDNGMHLTGGGYLATADWLFDGPRVEDFTLLIATTRLRQNGTDPIRWEFKNPRLLISRINQGKREPIRMIEVIDLNPGKYTMQVDGRDSITATAAEWAKGIEMPDPDLAQIEKLRKTIIAKNELYFNRWRPANVTYLFGFRKHEQGQNAREIPQFDPLIEAKEGEIAKLKKPSKHVYEIVPAKEKK